MINYTAVFGEVVAGRRWPGLGDALIEIESDALPPDPEAVSWRLRIDERRRGGAPAMLLDAESAAYADGVLTLAFAATAEQTADIGAAARRRLSDGHAYVDLEGQPPGGDPFVVAKAHGVLRIRQVTGAEQ